MDCFQGFLDANLRQHSGCWHAGNPHWVKWDHRVYPGVGVKHSSPPIVWFRYGCGGVVIDQWGAMGTEGKIDGRSG